MSPWQTIAEHWQELAQAAGIALGVGILAWTMLYILDHVVARFSGRTLSRLDDALLRASRIPIFVIIVFIGAQRSLADLTFLLDQWKRFFADFTYVGLLFGTWLLVYRVLASVLSWYSTDVASRTSTRLDDEFLPFLRRLVFLVTVGIAFAVALDHFNIAVGPFLGALGLTSLAVALAAQATLSDLIAGLVIVMDRPYRIGDYVQPEGIDAAGTVEDIGLMTTRIVTPDERAIIMPNARMKASRMINYTYPDPRLRLDLPVSVPRDVDVAAVKKLLIDTCLKLPNVLPDPAPSVSLVAIANPSLNLIVHCWLGNGKLQPVMVDCVLMAILNALNEANIK
ncbi:MAG: mechanosensitive ion channel family protein [Anaerolineae bacterium]|nr:mechanosensitive ion channel family protein [Anaerolineae bacterium]